MDSIGYSCQHSEKMENLVRIRIRNSKRFTPLNGLAAEKRLTILAQAGKKGLYKLFMVSQIVDIGVIASEAKQSALM